MNKKTKHSSLIIYELNDKCTYMREPPPGHWKRMREKLRKIHPKWFIPKELHCPINTFKKTSNKSIYTEISKN